MADMASPGASQDLTRYLHPGYYIDSDHPAVVEFAHAHTGPSLAPRDIAVRLYYAVRDSFPYDPYRIDTSGDGMKASRVIERGFGFCVPKAALLAAAARAVGVPARVGFADVRNHLSSARLRRMMGTDLFVFHGYTELWLDDRWVKATPAFNRALCDKAGIHPLEFDGGSDSVFHEFDARGRRHMEYVRDHGSYPDVPREALLSAWAEHYPSFMEWGKTAADGDFEAEVGQHGS